MFSEPTRSDSADTASSTDDDAFQHRQHRLGVLATLVTALLVLTGLTVGGIAVWTHEPESGAIAERDYRAPKDGSGFSTKLIDQPIPLPSSRWKGWKNQCEWATPELLKAIHATGPTTEAYPGCGIPLGDNTLQFSQLSPYTELGEAMKYLKSVKVAGLEAREYTFNSMGDTECGVEVNTRSFYSWRLYVFRNNHVDTGDREKRCATARNVAATIAKKYVPLAGGKPWPGPQRPIEAPLSGKSACDITGVNVALYGEISADPKPGSGALGSTCTFADRYSTATVLLTNGSDLGLRQVPPQVADARTYGRKLGTLPAREESRGDSCALAVELVPGQLLHVTYHLPAERDGYACKYAEVMATVTVGSLIEQS